ncbi:ABC transporter permease subunit [Pseudonocardia nematodicida]|uniref:ABC transporter permease subunit n=1 Tax=Pseudonocardia nematodicida TaxID=1206997 RepID=A0ABV1KDZ5_9PSEU
MSRIHAWLRRLSPLLVIATVVAIWYLVSRSANSLFFPPLTDVLVSFRELWFSATLLDQALPSFIRAGAGFAIALVGGVVMGTAIGLSPLIRQLTTAQLEFLRSIPPVLLIPPSLLLLGTGTQMKIAVIALASVWPILLATIDGVRSVETVRLDSARVFGLGAAGRVRWVVLPTAMPRIWSGVRACVPIVFVVMVAADYYASSDGIGYMISQTATSFRFSEMWASVLLLGIFGAAVNLAVMRAGRWLDHTFGEFGVRAA